MQESEATGPPTNTCDFKIDLEVVQEGGHYLKIKFNWISVDPATKEISFPQIDTGYLRDWKLIKIEGEEPVPEETEASQQYASNRGGAKAPAGGRGKPTPAQQKAKQ